MAQAKRKQVKTTKKTAQRTKKTSCTKCNNSDRNHIFIVTALSMITAILLCADAAIMMMVK